MSEAIKNRTRDSSRKSRKTFSEKKLEDKIKETCKIYLKWSLKIVASQVGVADTLLKSFRYFVEH